MSTPIPPGLKLGVVEPKAAVAAFDRRGLLMPSFSWKDVWQEEHARAFAVAGVMRLDILNLVRDELRSALVNGTSASNFRKAMRSKLVEKGWWGDIEVTDPATGESRLTRFDDRRLNLIFRTNVMQSYAAAKEERIQRSKARFPLAMYRTAADEKVRSAHRAWHNLVLPVDHPFWDTHTPKNGWNCRCTKVPMDEAELARREAAGDSIKREPPPGWDEPIPYVNSRTGEVSFVMKGIDPSFNYNPGKLRDAALHETVLRKAMDSEAMSGAVVVAQAAADHALLAGHAAARFAKWADEVSERGKSRGEMQHIGVLQPALLRALRFRDAGVQGAVISVTDTDAISAMRSGPESAISPASFRKLPLLLDHPLAVLRQVDAKPQLLLYVVEPPDTNNRPGEVLVVRLEQRVASAAGGRPGVILNMARGAVRLRRRDLADRERYELVWGWLDATGDGRGGSTDD